MNEQSSSEACPAGAEETEAARGSLMNVESKPPTGAGSWLARLGALLLRPLWTEDVNYRARRRCRTLIGTPFAAIAGLAWGVFAAPGLAGGVVLWAALGSFSFAFFMYLEQRVMPPLAWLVSRAWPRAGALAGLAWEALVVGGLFFLLTSVLGAPMVPAVGTALGLGAFYAVAMEYVVCGSAASNLAMLFQGGAAGSGARASAPYAHADALVHRGRVDEATRIYLDAIDYDGRDVHPYLALSRLSMRSSDFDQVISILRSALRRATLKPDEEAFIVRQIFEVCSSRLADPALALEDLELLISRQKRSEHATWARRTIRAIRKGSSSRSADGLASEGRNAMPAPPDGSTTHLPLELDEDRALSVSEDFEVDAGYSLGDDFVAEEGVTLDEFYRSDPETEAD